MTTSQKMSLSSVTSLKDERIPSFELGYLTAAARDAVYDAFVSLFVSESERDPRFTKAFIARRTGKSPEQISRYLGSPGNWTIDTYAILCAALGYRAVVHAEKISDMRRDNSCHKLYTSKAPSEVFSMHQNGGVFVGPGLNSLDRKDLQQWPASQSAVTKLNSDTRTNRAAFPHGARDPAKQRLSVVQLFGGNPLEPQEYL